MCYDMQSFRGMLNTLPALTKQPPYTSSPYPKVNMLLTKQASLPAPHTSAGCASSATSPSFSAFAPFCTSSDYAYNALRVWLMSNAYIRIISHTLTINTCTAQARRTKAHLEVEPTADNVLQNQQLHERKEQAGIQHSADRQDIGDERFERHYPAGEEQKY